MDAEETQKIDQHTYWMNYSFYVKSTQETLYRIFDPVEKRFVKGSSGKSSWASQAGARNVLNRIKKNACDEGKYWDIPTEVANRLMILEYNQGALVV
jgi:hypothetical protein